jgi:hypothetical protein
MTGPESVIVAIAAIAFLGSIAGSLTTVLLQRRKKSSPTQKLKRIVVEPADDGETGEGLVVEYEGPIPIKELLEAIRYVEIERAQAEAFQRLQRAQQEDFLRLQRVSEERAEAADRGVRMWEDYLPSPSALDEGHQPPGD